METQIKDVYLTRGANQETAIQAFLYHLYNAKNLGELD